MPGRTEQIQEHISAAAALIIPAASSLPRPGASTIAESLHALLWPYVVAAAQQFGASPAETVPGAEDKRSKPWQYIVRFWREESGDDEAELVGESDPAITTSTGALPKIITDMAAEMHDGAEIEVFTLENLKAMLPQFRNNLGRGMSAVLRIGPYEADGAAYRCQVDVYRLNGG